MKGRLLLNVVVGQSATVLQLLAREDQTLLVRRDSFLVLDLCLDIFDAVGRLDLQGDGLTSQGLDEDLHATAETEDEMKGGLLLDVVIRKGPAILKLLASKDETLLIGRDAFLVLNLGLHVLNRIAGLDLKGDGLASEGLDKDLHATSQAKHQVQGGLLLDVVVGKGPAILKLLASKDETLLIRRNAFLVLNLGLDILNGIAGLNLQSDGLSSEGLDKDLHATSQAEDKMESGLLLDVVVREGPSILKLLASEDQPLLIGRDTFFVLDLGLDVFDGITWLHFKSDGFACEGFDEDLHASSQSENEVKSGLLLDVVVGQGSSVLELLASEDETLLIGRDAFFVLDLCLDVFDGVRWLDLEGDGLASQGLDEDLHSTAETEDEMKSRLLLDVVVGQGPSVFKLLASEDETLLIRRNAFFVLDFGFDVLDAV